MFTFIKNIYKCFSTGQIAHILVRLDKIMFTQAETAQQLQEVKSTLTKASGEIVTRIGQLEAAIANAGGTSDEVTAIIADLKVIADSLDALNPDMPVDPVV